LSLERKPFAWRLIRDVFRDARSMINLGLLVIAFWLKLATWLRTIFYLE